MRGDVWGVVVVGVVVVGGGGDVGRWDGWLGWGWGCNSRFVLVVVVVEGRSSLLLRGEGWILVVVVG